VLECNGCTGITNVHNILLCAKQMEQYALISGHLKGHSNKKNELDSFVIRLPHILLRVHDPEKNACLLTPLESAS